MCNISPQRHLLAAFVLYALLITTQPVSAETGESPANDLKKLSIEQLMEIEVTSVSKKGERLSDAAAAVFVITHEDIRRSGVTSIPEALRMVPGLEVARIDSNKWAISSRGFNGRFANKMLVLFDGRTVYSPLFSGVFWDRQDTLLEDIDRIEVIRGSGATLWGANAVNGIINIITKNSGETQGGLVTAGGGTEERGFAGARYGFRVGEDTTLRLFTKYLDRGNFEDAAGRDAADGWHAARGGFRLDSEPSGKDNLTLQGDIYYGRLGETYTVPTLVAPFSRTFDTRNGNFGANLLSRWKHAFSASSDLALQFYYDHTDQDFSVLEERRDTFDLDFQHRFSLHKRQELLWGGGYRFTNDHIRSTDLLAFAPERRDDHLFSAFLQDDITLIANRLRLTLGAKFEHNDYTGFEWQPNARILWTPHERHTVWAAVSRAVRTPSRSDSDVRFNILTVPPGPSPLNPTPSPGRVVVNGSSGFEAEELISFELGYRVKPSDTLSVDIAAFYNRYHKLRNVSLPQLDIPNSTGNLTIINNDDAETYGVELATDWAPLEWWRICAAYTFLEMKVNSSDPSIEPTSDAGKNPNHQLSLRSRMELGRDVDFDLWLRYVDNLPAIDVGSYVTLDARLAWRPLRNLELSLVGRNLIHDRRLEFTPELINTQATGTERSFYGKITWTF
jgi:iron complex outermembrane receptor protein